MGKSRDTSGGMRGAKAKAQKAAALEAKQQKAAKEKEKKLAAEWAEGSNTRANKKKEIEAEKDEAKRQRAAAKKALLAQENEELSKMKAPKGKARKAQKARKGKQDFSALNAYFEEEKKKQAKKASRKTRVGEMPKLSINKNRQKSEEESKAIYSATGIDNAVSALNLATGGSTSPTDRHPEKRAKAAYLAFEEQRLVTLKSEMPGLKRSQYKERIWKEWQKSPENPRNQIPS